MATNRPTAEEKEHAARMYELTLETVRGEPFGEAAARVCDGVGMAVLALMKNGVEPTADAVAVLAAKIAEVCVDLEKKQW